jgi:predicted Zn-ribbon and HTH transcriptional regulator
MAKTAGGAGPRRCPKCGSLMQDLRFPMALVAIRHKRLGIMTQIRMVGVGLVVAPQRCSRCGFVELYAPNPLFERITEPRTRSSMRETTRRR